MRFGHEGEPAERLLKESVYSLALLKLPKGWGAAQNSGKKPQTINGMSIQSPV